MEDIKDIKRHLIKRKKFLFSIATNSRLLRDKPSNKAMILALLCYDIYHSAPAGLFQTYIDTHREWLSDLIAISKADIPEFISYVFKIPVLILSEKLTIMQLVSHQDTTEFNSKLYKQLTVRSTQSQVLHHLEKLYIQVNNKAGNEYRELYETQPFPNVNLTFIELLKMACRTKEYKWIKKLDICTDFEFYGICLLIAMANLTSTQVFSNTSLAGTNDCVNDIAAKKAGLTTTLSDKTKYRKKPLAADTDAAGFKAATISAGNDRNAGLSQINGADAGECAAAEDIFDNHIDGVNENSSSDENKPIAAGLLLEKHLHSNLSQDNSEDANQKDTLLQQLMDLLISDSQHYGKTPTEIQILSTIINNISLPDNFFYIYMIFANTSLRDKMFTDSALEVLFFNLSIGESNQITFRDLDKALNNLIIKKLTEYDQSSIIETDENPNADLKEKCKDIRRHLEEQTRKFFGENFLKPMQIHDVIVTELFHYLEYEHSKSQKDKDSDHTTAASAGHNAAAGTLHSVFSKKESVKYIESMVITM